MKRKNVLGAIIGIVCAAGMVVPVYAQRVQAGSEMAVAAEKTTQVQENKTTQTLVSEAADALISETGEAQTSEPTEDVTSEPTEDATSEPTEDTTSEPAEDTTSETTQDLMNKTTEKMEAETEALAFNMEEGVPFVEIGPLTIDNTQDHPAYEIVGDELNIIKGLKSGTIFAEFTPNGQGYQSIFGVSNSQEGFPNTYFQLYFSGEKLGFELRDQVNKDFEKAFAEVSLTKGTTYKVAMTADEEYGYKIYLDGKKVLDIPIASLSTERGYGFLADIPGLDKAYAGKTERNEVASKPPANNYLFKGIINQFKLYASALDDATLERMTLKTKDTWDDYESELIVDEKNLQNTDIPKALPESLGTVSSLTSGTIITKFTTTSTGIQSLISISNGAPGFANSYFNLYCRQGKIGFEIRQQSGGDYEKRAVEADINPGEENYLAFVADENYGYKVFLNGEFILDVPMSAISSPLGYGFTKQLSGMTDCYIGKTKRVMADSSKVNEYLFSGSIASLKVYSTPVLDQLLLEETGTISQADRKPVQKINLFQVSDWNSPAFRIPSLITLKNGTLLAVCDIRYGNSNDSPNNIDTGIRRSTDGGNTWSEPELILNFLDFPNKPTDQLIDSASFIDPVMVESENGRVYLFVDAMRGGVGQANAIAHTGFVEVEGEQRIALEDSGKAEYSLGHDNIVYDANNKATEYIVKDGFELYKNGTKISNIFYKNAPITVIATTYVVMCYSDDNGVSWSKPEITNFKTPDMKFFGVAPGIGITLKNGAHQGRMVVPMYYTSSLHTTEWACLMYSDDNGLTWKRGESPNQGRIGGENKLHESQVVEMPDGQLKMYSRSLSKASVSTSFDGGETWDDEVVYDETLIMSKSSGCQLSIINYSQPINGKPAVIFSNPAALTRSQGTVRVGLIEENGTYTSEDPNKNGRSIYQINWVSSKLIRNGEFAYSCLAELPNHNIANLYEENNTRFTLDHLVYAEYSLKYLMGSILNQ